MLRSSFHSLFKNKFYAALTFLLFAGCAVYLCREFPLKSDYRDIWYYMMESQELSLICFVVFLFLSYEFLGQLRQQNLYEAVNAVPGGLPRAYGARAGALVIVDALLTLVFLGYHIVGYFVRPIPGTEVLFHVILVQFLDIFCVCLAAIFIGMLFSLLKSKLLGYGLIVAMVFFGSPIAESFISSFANMKIVNLYPIYRYFHLFPPDLSFTPNWYFGISLLPYRWEAVAFWCALGLVGLFAAASLGRGRKGGRRRCAAFVAVTVALGAALLFPGSTVELHHDPKATVLERQVYYGDYLEGMKGTPADFRVTGYQLKLKIRNSLSAEVTMAVDQKQLAEYHFTLYHTYHLKRVETQDGSSLPFTQEKDFITVQNPEKKTVTALTMKYSGYSYCYANLQGTSLPGNFAYYPQAGHLLLASDTWTMKSMLQPSPVPFEAEVSAPYRLYSNLKQEGRGRFSGTTDAFTLVGGFLKEEVVNGIGVVYPYSAPRRGSEMMDEETKIISRIYAQAKAQGIAMPNFEKIIVVDSVTTDRDIYFCSDHMITGSSWNSDTIQRLFEQRQKAKLAKEGAQ